MKAIAQRLRRAGGRGAGDRGRLRRRADLQRRSRHAGGGARSAGPRGRRASGCRSTRVEDALKRQQRAKERFLARAGRGAAARRRARCAQVLGRDEHRAIADEMARFAVMLKPRALRPGRPPRRRRSRQPVRPRGVRPAASRRSGGSASSRSTTTRCSRGSGYVAGPPRAARRGDSRGLARSVDRRRSSPCAAATAARRCCRCSIATRRGAPRKPFIGYSDLTALLTFLTLGCELVAFHGPMLAGRLGRGADGLRPRLVRCARSAGASRWASWRRPALEIDSRRARPPASLLGGTLTQLLASLGTPFAFAPPPGYVLFSTKSASARTGSIAW